MTTHAAPSPLHQRWVHRTFLKDAKLHPRERYWRTTTSCLTSNDKNSAGSTLLDGEDRSIRIIPDGIVWRKYLQLLQTLITKHSDSLQWTLLESAAELMDHRNQSPCVADHTRREYCHAQERHTLMRLVRQCAVQVFCDLSVRDDDGHDEWEWLHYDQLTIDERSRQALLRAARMMLDQQNDNCKQNAVWILSEEAMDDQIQLEDGVQVVSMNDLMERLVERHALSNDDARSLHELKEACENDYDRMNRPPEALGASTGSQTRVFTPEEIRNGLRDKRLCRGRLNVTKENPREAFVAVDKMHYFVDKQRGHFYHAFHGDMVILEPLPQAEWGRPVGRHRIVNYKDGDDDDRNDGALEDVSVPTVPSARVVAVDEPSRRVFIATMVNMPRDNDSHVLVVPMDLRIPKLRIHSKFWRTYTGMRLKVQVDDWEEGSTYPSGRCLQVMGPIGDLETEVAALLLENQVDLEPFSAAALACLPPQGDNWTISDQEVRSRRDLRTCRQIFSVDPPGCQDIDDTMHAVELPNGDIEFGVHIADVTHLVAHNSALDKEAQVRGTTFYLVDRRFDMLPTLLSSNLCSLHGNVDRLAVSVIWVMSSDLGQIKSTWYGRTVIRNCAAMTYDQADRILQDQSPDSSGSTPPPPLTAGGPVDRHLIKDLKPALSLLTRLARKLRKDRETIGGAVDLSSGDVGNELKFTLVDGKPVKVVPKKDKEIHHTIAEMMILANTSVATKIYEHFPDCALLRIHQTVEEDRFEELKDILDASKIRFDGKSSADVAKSLTEAKQRVHSNPVVSALLLSLATRAMSEAQYVSAGDGCGGGADFSHYGLGLKYYTHFTSPIRRYADVVVHKQLLAALQAENTPAGSPRQTERLSTCPQIVQSLPDSNVISIMAGEGLHREIEDDQDFLDGLIEGAADLALTPDTSTDIQSEHVAVAKPSSKLEVYSGPLVSLICENLNLHNRLAKYSSYECQRLFLSLYFRENVEMTDAVVVNIRSNGIWVYLPRFDIKVPVYLKDVSGQLQVDPILLGLPSDAGAEATLGFASSGAIRRFPDGQCTHVMDEDERLVVSVPGASVLTVRPLDVVHVQVTCDKWDASARVPNPRVQLLALSNVRSTFSSFQGVKINSQVLKPALELPMKEPDEALGDPTISSVISALEIHPVLQDISQQLPAKRITAQDRNVTLAGRFVYSSFVNPDSRSTKQESAQQNAATDSAKRRADAMAQAAHRSEFDTVKRYEREAMLRQQRLASDKRNARISKNKKGK